MSLTIFTHQDCLKHDMGPMHPESPARLKTINQALQQAPFSQSLVWQEAPMATKADLLRVHHADYIEKIFNQAPSEGYLQLDPDTIMNKYSLTAALRAAGALKAAVDSVFMQGPPKAFCAVRPPGHHAEPHAAMGFCFFNNIAIGVSYALEKYHCERLAIVDFDVHHGNGTETMFLKEPRVCFWSSFQHPFYPGTEMAGKPAHIHLCPMRAGEGSQSFRDKVDKELIPLLDNFKPQCLFISAGFDAHQLDPLANLNLTTADYAYVTQKICQIADMHAHKRVISTLEGGYNLDVLAEAVTAHVQAMLAIQAL
ncbi:MAG: histone deacetylase family protein [Proteobacteria bacterium]|nr:histone deacetylase family protein [Pseudomonadota bacterium]